jgi:Animal haem peroxidase
MTELFHGTWWDLHKNQSLEEVTNGRFTKLLPGLDPAAFDPDDLRRLAEEMTSRQERRPTPETERDPEEDREIPAAYTYLGQFVDHDITFDPTSTLREFLDPEQINALADFRTPRLDLDNLYGRGPADQPYMYERDGIHMLLGERMSGNPYDVGSRQVPRGPSGRALIGDPRNDENRIVAQLHAIFLRFHNQVAKHLGGKANFEKVREQVRWHYQWVLVTDYLPTVINNETFTSVFPNPHEPVLGLPGLQNGLKLMPVEFSVAAFRFGHSMIRPEYRLNTTVERRPIFSRDRHDGAPTDNAADLGGFRHIPSDWAIDWQFFVDLEHGAKPEATAPLFDPLAREPQMAYKIDTSLVSPLRRLPHRIAFNPSMLALRNLRRGATFELPSGQDVARALGEEPIPDEDVVIGKATADDPKKPLVQIAEGFAGKAPLWAYILSEAQVVSWEKADSGVAKDDIPIKLGPVGGRIVAEVFAALLRGDPTSYLRRKTAFRPIPEFTHDGRFGLAELINVALGRAP